MELSNMPAIYVSDRDKGEVLQGQDDAASLLQLCNAGHDAKLDQMLNTTRWQRVALSRPHRIYCTTTMGGIRRVFATPMLNVEAMLELACRGGHAATVRLILDWSQGRVGADTRLITRSVVSAALDCTAPVEVFTVLAAYDPACTLRGLGHGISPLSEAIQQSDTPLVEFLVTHGADVATVEISDGESLLSFAVSHSSAEIVRVLLARGAPLAQSGALHMAAACGKIDIMELLVAQGTLDVNELRPKEVIRTPDKLCEARGTPLHFAATFGQAESMAWLQEHGARMDAQDAEGKTPAEVWSYKP